MLFAKPLTAAIRFTGASKVALQGSYKAELQLRTEGAMSEGLMR